MKIILLATILVLSGCTTIDTQVKDWPKLEIKMHKMSFWDIQMKCWTHMPFIYKILGGVAMACAEINFDTNRCDIYHLESNAFLDHEISHCNGGDHDGILQSYADSKKVAP